MRQVQTSHRETFKGWRKIRIERVSALLPSLRQPNEEVLQEVQEEVAPMCETVRKNAADLFARVRNHVRFKDATLDLAASHARARSGIECAATVTEGVNDSLLSAFKRASQPSLKRAVSEGRAGLSPLKPGQNWKVLGAHRPGPYFRGCPAADSIPKAKSAQARTICLSLKK
jgi:hypothetical protein